MGSFANSFEGIMKAALALLFCVQAVYMKTYLIETKSKITNPVKIERAVPVPEPVNSWDDQENDSYENGADYTDSYVPDDEDGADYTDDYQAGQDYKAAKWSQPTTTTSTTTSTSTLAPCTLSEWGAWIKEQPCGQTRQKRTRSCKRGDQICSAIECSGSLEEVQPVTLGECCKWSTWNPWSTPSDMCVDAKIHRERTCISNVAGFNCHNNINQCSGESKEERTIPGVNCCEWTAWKNVACSVTCGSGTQTKTRVCSNKGTDCESSKCQGPASESSACNNLPACPVPVPSPVETAPSWK